jgi:copper transport protein
VRTSAARRLLTALLAAAAAALAAPAVAGAHAQLEGTVPARGATVAAPPAAVAFRFDEPVEGSFGAVRVFDAAGRRVDDGDPFHPGGRGAELAVRVRRDLPQGTYTATYRVVSADSHVVSGGFVFSVGRAGGAPARSVAELVGTGAGPVTQVAAGLARGLQYAAIALAVGALGFALLAWRPALAAATTGDPAWAAATRAFAARMRALVGGAALAGLLASLAGLVLQGASAAGVSAWAAASPRVVGAVLDTRFGLSSALAALAWATVAAATRPAPGRWLPVLRPVELGATGLALAPRRAAGAPLVARAWTRISLAPGDVRALAARTALLAVPLAWVALAPVVAGHAATQRPALLLVPADLVHILAMSLWAGGLACLVVVLPAATRRLAPPERTRLLHAVLARFSPLALGAVAALALTGLVQAVVYVRTPGNVVDTAFGRAVGAKALLLLGLIAVGAWHRRRGLPGLGRRLQAGAPPGAAGVGVRRALRGEVALIAVVLGVTAALTSYAPSVVAASGPQSATTMVGPAQLQLTVDPARPGPNEIHLYLLDPRDGRQYTAAEEVRVDASLPDQGLGPLSEPARRAGPGHFVVAAAPLPVAGRWRLQVTVRVSDFDEYTGRTEVRVR